MKMNIDSRSNRATVQCTNCNHIFKTDKAKNPYHEMLEIAHGKYKFCPSCGEKYEGMLVDGKPLAEHDESTRHWASINRIR